MAVRKPLTLFGVTYSSCTEAAAGVGISYSVFNGMAREAEYDEHKLEALIDEYSSKQKRSNFYSDWWRKNSCKFPDTVGFSRWRVRIQREGNPTDDETLTLLAVNGIDSPNIKGYVYNGKVYRSLDELHESLPEPHPGLQSLRRQLNLGKSIDTILEEYRRSREVYAWKGNTFASTKELHAEMTKVLGPGMAYSTVKRKINQGWSLEEIEETWADDRRTAWLEKRGLPPEGCASWKRWYFKHKEQDVQQMGYVAFVTILKFTDLMPEEILAGHRNANS